MAYVNKNSYYIGTYICVFPAEVEEFLSFYVVSWIERGLASSRKGYKPELSFASLCKQFKRNIPRHIWR